MTIKDLIEKLQQLDPEMRVIHRSDQSNHLYDYDAEESWCFKELEVVFDFYDDGCGLEHLDYDDYKESEDYEIMMRFYHRKVTPEDKIEKALVIT